MARSISLALGLVAAVSAAAWADTPSPVVTIGVGSLRGAAEGGVATFRGIPYAAPPVGDLRWRPPEPPAPRTGVRDATGFGPACPQSPDSPIMMAGSVGASSEDCLTLNVWKPIGAAAARMPVMVWIHGGGFFTGSGSERQFDGGPYARRGVILVTINYRLGRLGFFAHPALDRETPGAPRANYGLMDIMAALGWVRANIAAFGGDPGNVTIFGESAGGIAIVALMASPLARGLFQKAIVESGAFPVPMRDLRVDRPGLPSAETLGRDFAQSVGIAGDGSTAALRALPIEKIAPSAPAMADIGRIQAMAAPVIDGQMFTEDIFRTFSRRDQAKVPLLIGSNSLEALVWAFPPDRKVTTYPILPVDPAAVLGGLGPDRDRIVDAYRARFDGDMAKMIPTIATDMTVGAGTGFLADRAAETGSAVYLYRFAAVPAPLRGVTFGAPHGTEIPYVFDTLAKLRDVGDRTTGADHALSTTIIDYWTAFAKTGDPNCCGHPVWPVHTAESGAMLEVTNAGTAARSDATDPMAALFSRRMRERFASSANTP